MHGRARARARARIARALFVAVPNMHCELCSAIGSTMPVRWVRVSWVGVLGLRLGVPCEGAGFRIQQALFSVQCSAFTIQGSGFRGQCQDEN